MKVKVIRDKDYWNHIQECPTCCDMEERGYRDEGKYWDDFFAHNEKPIKYKLLKGGVYEEVVTSRAK